MHSLFYRILSIVVGTSFLLYLVCYFILRRFNLNYAENVTYFIFSMVWFGMLIFQTKELLGFRRQLLKFFKDDVDAQQVNMHLFNYCRMNILFGLGLCVTQVLTYFIDVIFNDEISASVVNICFDITCIGTASWYVYICG